MHSTFGGQREHLSKGENIVGEESKDLSFIPSSVTRPVAASVHFSGQQCFPSEMRGLYFLNMVCKALIV